METENCPDQDQAFQHDYDDEHDSDVEARLYAEVYYSNTIIGEENNTNNSTSENQCPGTVDNSEKGNGNNQDLLHDNNVTQDKSNKNNICDNNLAILNDSTNNVSTKTKNLTNEIKTDNFSKHSASTHKINNLSNTSNTPNTKKRTTHSCLDEANKSSKRKKQENQNGVRESTKSQSNGPYSKDQSNQERIDQNNGSALVNPYNKNVIGNGQKSINLLSPEFINVFFAGKSRKKKKKDYPIKKNSSNKNNSTIPSSGIGEQSGAVLNNLENDVSSNSAVIDISSESSNESFENDSKYNAIVATDRKLKQRESGLKTTNTKYNVSDSEESIFEVPVPPKPAPPVIEVRDSDNEREHESDDNSFLNDSLISQDSVIQNGHETSLDSSLNKTHDICEIISDSDDSNSLVLNCTTVQRGMSSLNEIKKLNQQTSTPNKRNSSTTKSSNNSLDKSELSNSPATTAKSTDNLRNKQKSKPPNKNISSAEYFFQPMNEKMISFYNDSWGGENFDMDRMKSNMSNDPNKWAILNKDLVLTGPKKKRYFGMTCARCHREGHRQNNCPEPNKGPTCHMCGTEGHYATYCPHTKCLTCGRQQTMYRTTCGYCKRLYCSRCSSQGHRDDSCPDLWRRYHHTTNSPAPKIPLNVKNVMKSRHELVCCNCTKQGHDSPACKRLRWSQHFPNPSSVTHYSGPSYTANANSDEPIVIDDIQEDSYKNTNSVTSNIVPSNFPRSDRRNENNIQSSVEGLPSVADPNKKIIFNICRLRTKFNNDNQSKKSAIRSVTLKLNVPDKTNPGSIEKWKKLTNFLKGLGYDLKSEFSLELKDKQLYWYMQSSRKFIESLSTLIKQYSSRSEFERSQMLLSGERDLKRIVELLSRKFAEMKDLSGDISMLYDETRRLREELLDNDGRIQNESQNRLKLNELVVSQQKLLMLLYREGFGDESLGQLRKIFLKMQKSIEQHSDKRKLKKDSKYVPAVPLLSLKLLFTYLYYYNNIFIAHESKQLDTYIQKYKDNLEKRNKLMNNSLLFPQEANKQQADSNEKPAQDGTSSEETLVEDSSEPSTSTAQKLPISQNTTVKTPTSSTSNVSLNSKLPNQTLVSPNQQHERKLNHLYQQALTSQNQTRQANLMQNFRNFIKNARNCVEQASKLNSPRLHDDIVALRRELDDETHLSTNKVRKFKKKVREERMKLLDRPVLPKKQKNKKLQKKVKKTYPPPNNAENVYKKFCASL